MMHLIQDENVSGAVNFTAPEPLTMSVFGRTIGSVLHRPHWLPVPEFGLRLLFGEMADLLVKGQRVLPQKAIDSGYLFRFPTAQSALQDLLK
jgi:NAD dependent epimerase/dehydratase family enzyme